MNNKVRAIPTKYKKNVFRSRTEARWAVYLDLMGFDWEYESEGYTDGENSYLPDFTVKDFSSDKNEFLFIEVKPERSLTEKEIDKILVAKNIADVFVVFGTPSSRSGLLFSNSMIGDERQGADVVLQSPYGGGRDYGVFFHEEGWNPRFHSFEEGLSIEAMDYDIIYGREFEMKGVI